MNWDETKYVDAHGGTEVTYRLVGLPNGWRAHVVAYIGLDSPDVDFVDWAVYKVGAPYRGVGRCPDVETGKKAVEVFLPLLIEFEQKATT